MSWGSTDMNGQRTYLSQIYLEDMWMFQADDFLDDEQVKWIILRMIAFFNKDHFDRIIVSIVVSWMKYDPIWCRMRSRGSKKDKFGRFVEWGTEKSKRVLWIIASHFKLNGNCIKSKLCFTTPKVMMWLCKNLKSSPVNIIFANEIMISKMLSGTPTIFDLGLFLSAGSCGSHRSCTSSRAQCRRRKS